MRMPPVTSRGAADGRRQSAHEVLLVEEFWTPTNISRLRPNARDAARSATREFRQPAGHLVQVVVELRADKLHAGGEIEDRRVRVRGPDRAAMHRHLRKLLANERRFVGFSVTFAWSYTYAANTFSHDPSRYSTSLCTPQIRVRPRFCRLLRDVPARPG